MALIERNFDGQDFAVPLYTKMPVLWKELRWSWLQFYVLAQFQQIFFYILPCMMQKIYDADYYSTRRMQRDDINEIHAENKTDVTDIIVIVKTSKSFQIFCNTVKLQKVVSLGYLGPFLLEAVEASLCHFFENWLMKLKFPNLLNPL